MAAPTAPDESSTAAPPPRPTAWFLHTAARTLGPLAIDDLRGYFNAGMVGGEATVSGPDWDGRLPAIDAATRLGVARPPAVVARVAAAPMAPTGPENALRSDPIWYRPAGPDWRWLALWGVALAVVQWLIVPAGAPEAADSTGARLAVAAREFALVAVACFAVVGLVLRALRGEWPGARGPLLAMSAVYAVLGVQHVVQRGGATPAPTQVAAAPAGAPATPRRPSDRAVVDADVAGADDGAGLFGEPVESPANGDPTAIDEAPPDGAVADPVAPQAASATARVPAATPVDGDPSLTTARNLYRAADWRRLLDHATAWSRQQPRRFEPWQFLGVAQRNLGLPAAALGSFEQAVALGARDAATLRNLCFAQLQARDWPRAAAACERILADEPDSVFALANYAHAMSQQGEYDEALAALERAAKVAPRDRRVWAALADVHRRGGFPDRERAALEKANSIR